MVDLGTFAQKYADVGQYAESQDDVGQCIEYDRLVSVGELRTQG